MRYTYHVTSLSTSGILTVIIATISYDGTVDIPHSSDYSTWRYTSFSIDLTSSLFSSRSFFSWAVSLVISSLRARCSTVSF